MQRTQGTFKISAWVALNSSPAFKEPSNRIKDENCRARAINDEGGAAADAAATCSARPDAGRGCEQRLMQFWQTAHLQSEHEWLPVDDKQKADHMECQN